MIVSRRGQRRVYFSRGDIHPVIATPVALGVLVDPTPARGSSAACERDRAKLFLPIVLYLALSMLLRGLGVLG